MGAGPAAQQPEFDPQNPHNGGRREPSPQKFSDLLATQWCGHDKAQDTCKPTYRDLHHIKQNQDLNKIKLAFYNDHIS